MKVTAGTARGIPLKTPKERSLRPSQNQVRLAVCSILESSYLDEKGFANKEIGDFYAGTGALGIETLSRGAAKATFIEASKKHVRVIQENLSKTKFEKQATVVTKNINEKFLSSFSISHFSFHILFIDPPYKLFNDINLANFIPFVKENGVLVYLHSAKNKPKETLSNEDASLTLVETREYGSTGVSFYTNEKNLEG